MDEPHYIVSKVANARLKTNVYVALWDVGGTSSDVRMPTSAIVLLYHFEPSLRAGLFPTRFVMTPMSNLHRRPDLRPSSESLQAALHVEKLLRHQLWNRPAFLGKYAHV